MKCLAEMTRCTMKDTVRVRERKTVVCVCVCVGVCERERERLTLKNERKNLFVALLHGPKIKFVKKKVLNP